MIHKYTLNGHYIVLDVNSGGIHLVDELTYKMLDVITLPLSKKCHQTVYCQLSDYKVDEIDSAYKEIYTLYKAGQMFSVDDYQQFEDKFTISPVKAMCLHIAHDCNLRCEYCFASTGDFGVGRKLMSSEVGKKAIDFLIAHSDDRHNLELDFFGGEPLMNFDVVKEIVNYARSLEKKYDKLFRFTITTNGLLLDDDKIAFINKEMSNVVLSIDGRQSVNDKVRSTVSGGGCYDLIMPKFVDLVKQRNHENYYVRGTFTKYNLDFANDVIHLHKLGFDQISVEPVVSDSNQPYAISVDDIPAISAEYERLAEYIIAKEREKDGLNFFHFMLDLEQGPCAIKRLRGCGCGNEYLAVTPEGDLYPCHQFVGHDEWKMGDVFSDKLDMVRKEQFAKSTVYAKKACRDCWAKFYCSGGCSANSMQYNNDILAPHELSCELEKKRVEVAIMIKAELLSEE